MPPRRTRRPDAILRTTQTRIRARSPGPMGSEENVKHPGKTVAKTTILAFLAVAIGLSVAVLQLHDQGNGESAYASSGGRVGRSTAPGCNACPGGGGAPTVTLSG